MEVSIKRNKPYKLSIPEFVCDYELKKSPPPQPFNLLTKGYRFICIIGRPQSGKTSLLVSLFKDKRLLKKTFNNVLLVAPEESMNSLKDGHNVFKDLSEEKFFPSLEHIDEIMEQIKYYRSQDEDTCLIIDDQTAYLKDIQVQKVLSEIVMNRRHLKTTIIILSQIYNKIPLSIRKLINVAIILYRPSKKECEDLFEELFEYDKLTAQKIMHLCWSKPYDMLTVDPVNRLMYHNADEIIVGE